MKFEIKNRFTGGVIYTCELDEDVENKSYGFKLGFAVKLAIKSHANLHDADLSYANLRYADLSYADLSHADLSHANLRYADLSHANLHHADLSHADLSDADLSNAIGVKKPKEE